MTDNFKELREALDAGVTGASESHDSIWMKVGSTVMLNSGRRPVWARIAGCEHEPNARYIAAANPVVIRSLLDRLEAAERDAERWRTFIGLGYETRAEWAANLSLAPVLTSWVDAAMKEQRP